MMPAAILETKKVAKRFGGVSALKDIDLSVYPSEILGLIGPNGSGKTTLFNVISGFFKPTQGQVLLEGQEISTLKASQIARMGVSRVFQEPTLFLGQTVLDNVFFCFHLSYKTPWWSRLLRMPAPLREEKALIQKARELLGFAGLSRLKDEKAENLSYGDQRILNACMALAAGRQLLLLDEPVAGMSPQETALMVNLIRQIQKQGVTIMIVEHDMKTIMDLCDRLVVLNHGEKIAEGDPAAVCAQECVIEAYLGQGEG